MLEFLRRIRKLREIVNQLSDEDNKKEIIEFVLRDAISLVKFYLKIQNMI